jgi:hypothetical protein
MDIEELQTKITREKWRDYEAAQAARAGTSASREVAAVIAAYTAKRPHVASLVPSPAEPGPLTRQALKVAAAISRARAGQVGEASANSGRAVHKLPTYVIGRG